jgi:IPT/TIG domain
LTELTALLSPSSTAVTSVVSDIQPVALTLSLVNNDSTAADVSGGLMVEFTADPGVSTTDKINGPVKALLASNFTADPYLMNSDGSLPPVTLLGPGVTAVPAADIGWGIDSGSLEGAILVFTALPNGPAQYMLAPGVSITFTFSGVSVDTIPGVSTVTVSVQPSIQSGGTAATIGTQPQVQKVAVPLMYPVVSADPPVLDPPTGPARLNPPASETLLTWSNDGAGSCTLDWDNLSTVVTYAGATVAKGGGVPLIVTAEAPARAILRETDAFTVCAYGTGIDGTVNTKSTPVTVHLNPPEFTAITVPPVATGVWPPSGDPAGGQQITITGLGLTATSAVTLTPVGAHAGGASAASFTVISDTQVTAITPAGTGLADVTLKTPVGTSPIVSEDIFTYAPAGTPVVSGVFPASGTVDGGDQVTITGVGLGHAISVTFTPPVGAGVSVIPTVGSDGTLSVTSPVGVGVVDITVTATSVTFPVTSPVTPAGRYTYIQAGSPLVTGVALTDPAPPGGTPPARPPIGGDPAGGQPVTITGTGLANASAVTFISLAAGTSAAATDVTVISDTQVTATTPTGSGVVDVIVTASGQDSPATVADRFGYGIQAGTIPPYQPFQLIWSCYQGWNHGFGWQLTGDSAGAPSDPDTVTVTGDTSLDCVRAIVTTNRGATFTLTLPPGSQALPGLPVNIAPVQLAGFTSTVPVWNPDTGEQTVTLTWVAANVAGFSLTQNGVPLPPPTYDQREYPLSLPLSGPVTYMLTAYGYDQNGTAERQIPQNVEVTPFPVSVSNFRVTDLQVINAITGQQRVTLGWQAQYAAYFEYGGAGHLGILGPSATSLELDLPLPPPSTGPVSYEVVLVGRGYVDNIPGRTNEATTTITPYPVQLNSFTATVKEISHNEQATLTWSADYATGFTLEPGGSFPANATWTRVTVYSTTTYTLVAQGYPAGPELPHKTVRVKTQIKENPDKLIPKETILPESVPAIPGGPLPAGAGSEPSPPAALAEQAGGQQAFIGPDERPDVGLPPPPGTPASSLPRLPRSGMILLIAGRAAQRALRGATLRAALSDFTRNPDVRLVAPADLSAPGWAHDPADPAASRLTLPDGPGQAGQITYPAGKITAVLTALDAVWPADLPHVRPADRAFVAAEMTAFLRDWLATMDCPVLDRPTTLTLSGPAGERAAWSAAAAALGVPDRQVTAVPRGRLQTVTVAAGRIIGPAPGPPTPSSGRQRGPVTSPVAATALALARTAGVTAARLTFTTGTSGVTPDSQGGGGTGQVPTLCAATPWWHVPDPLVLRALFAEALARGRSDGASAARGAVAARSPSVSARLPLAAATRPARPGAHAPARPIATPLVLLWGIPEEETLAAVQAALAARGARIVVFDQRRTLSARVSTEPGGATMLRLAGRRVPLAEVTAAYPRPYPSVPQIPGDMPARLVACRHIRRVEHELWHWLATTSALVVNRPGPSASNGTKPAQTRVAGECGFLVPESLLTNDAQAAIAFAARCGQVVYKGAGGSRTITGLLDPADHGRLAHLATCPTYLQRYIVGSNVRVHVAGDAIFAVEIDSDAVDYRRHARELRLTRIPEAVADRCRAVTAALGLLLAGIDLIRTPAGEWFFLEANPSPGFTFYPDRDLVAAAVARLLLSAPAEGAAISGTSGQRP